MPVSTSAFITSSVADSIHSSLYCTPWHPWLLSKSDSSSGLKYQHFPHLGNFTSRKFLKVVLEWTRSNRFLHKRLYQFKKHEELYLTGKKIIIYTRLKYPNTVMLNEHSGSGNEEGWAGTYCGCASMPDTAHQPKWGTVKKHTPGNQTIAFGSQHLANREGRVKYRPWNAKQNQGRQKQSSNQTTKANKCRQMQINRSPKEFFFKKQTTKMNIRESKTERTALKVWHPLKVGTSRQTKFVVRQILLLSHK